ncbi:MAG: GNAT family N-acetyltransferase [Geminicoccales bacterium]
MASPLTWRPKAKGPARATLAGEAARLEPLDPARHGDSLWAEGGRDAPAALWDYMSYGPFAGRTAFDAFLAEKAASGDPLFFAVVDTAGGRAKGMASYLRNDGANGVIEIGHIWFGPALQKTRAASEAIFLFQKDAFEALGYRRLEWKCDARNLASRRAALRFGFAFEGILRQHMVVKGRNRDTAWYALLDRDWPAAKTRFERWLDPANFDAAGKQKTSLGALNDAATKAKAEGL